MLAARRSFLLALLVAACVGGVAAQTAPPEGIATLVVDLTAGGEPAVGVTVEAAPTEPDTSRAWPVRKQTGASGRAIFAGLPAGSYTVTARPGGAAAEAFAVSLAPGQGALAEISLADTRPLGGVAVEADRLQPELERAGFYRRQRTIRGTLYDREAVLADDPPQLSDFLQVAPNVGIRQRRNGPVIVNEGFRTCNYDVWIDRTLVIQGEDADQGGFDLDTIRVSDIAGVEVYHRAREVPAEFKGSRCGTVLIWTRP